MIIPLLLKRIYPARYSRRVIGCLWKALLPTSGWAMLWLELRLVPCCEISYGEPGLVASRAGLRMRSWEIKEAVLLPHPRAPHPKPWGRDRVVVVVAAAASFWEPLPTSTKHVAFPTRLSVNWGLCPQGALRMKGVNLPWGLHKVFHMWSGLMVTWFWTTRNPVWVKHSSLIHPPLMLVLNTYRGCVRRITLKERQM